VYLRKEPPVLRKLIIVTPVFALVIGCGVEAGDDTDKRNVAELEARGFGSPSLVADGYDDPLYNVTFGKCRANVQYDEGYWTLTRVQDEDVKSLSDVDVVTIESKAAGLGLEYCF
jgi:hypothetical protein